MNCRKAIRQLPAYLDHELSDREANMLERHLNVCVFCSTELSSLRATSKMLDSWGDASPQRSHAAAVIKQIQAREQGVMGSERTAWSFWTSHFPSLSLRAAASLLFLVVSVLFYTHLPVSERTANVSAGVLDGQESLKRLMSLDGDARHNFIRPSEFWLALRGVEQPASPIPDASWGAAVRQATRDDGFFESNKFPVVEHIYFPGEGMPVESFIPVGEPQ